MKIIIDRFEGNYAVCEKDNREMVDIERNKLPVEAKEGDVLDVSGNVITVDREETEKRKKRVEELTKDLWA